MDWQTLIRDLRNDGMTLQAIAESAGTGLSTISEIGRGATREPRGNLAARLLQVHARRATAPQSKRVSKGTACASQII